jgi:hypothetical protein
MTAKAYLAAIKKLGLTPAGQATAQASRPDVESACLVRFWKPTCVQIQMLAAKFPTQQNREFLRGNRIVDCTPRG